jgi:hypothetical protein
MSTENSHPRTDRTVLRTLPNHGHWYGVYHALEVPPDTLTVDRCQASDCGREDKLQFVESPEGDVRIYCPMHHDQHWKVKIR